MNILSKTLCICSVLGRLWKINLPSTEQAVKTQNKSCFQNKISLFLSFFIVFDRLFVKYRFVRDFSENVYTVCPCQNMRSFEPFCVWILF